MPSKNNLLLSPTPLDIVAASAAVSSCDAGGINLFLGTTRAESHPTHGTLLALDYQAYTDMALAEFQKIATAAHAQWPIHHLLIWHRTGRVPVGAPSVIIAVSTPHRAESFEATRYCIDQLKKSAPIWKKEIYARDSLWQSERFQS